MPALNYSYRKAQKRLSSDERIIVNNTYAFTTNALQRALGFNPSIF
jgi:hypothetical protein